MNKKGFTLIEIVMVIVVLSIIVPGIMFFFTQGVKDSVVLQTRNTAIFLAEALMEEISSKNWDDGTSIDSICSNASTSLGADGESRATYDDIDDFDGLNNTPLQDSQGVVMNNYQGFTRQVAVMYVDATVDLETSVAGPTCYKKIEVTVTGSGEDIQLVSLMTSY